MTDQADSRRRPARGPRVGLAQISPALGDLPANVERHRHAVAQAVEDGCDLLVFPELSLTGYRLKDSVPDVALRRGSETWAEMESLSKGISLVVGFVEESADHHFYNAAAWFEGGKCLAVHRKCYLPTYGMFDEQRYFARGRGVAAFDTRCGRVAMLVCEDILHPSALTVAACDGATMIVVPSASPARGVIGTGEADSNARSWEAYNHVMARTFGVWIAYCNRVGVEDGVTFWGGAEVISPAGERVVKASYYDEDFVSAVLPDDAVRRRRLANPTVRDEDLDLTINELSRIRGRAVVEASAAAPAASPAAAKGTGDGERAPRRPYDDERRGGTGDGERPPRRPWSDDRRGGGGDGERPPRRPWEERGGGRGGDDRGERPRFGGAPRDRFQGGGGPGPRPGGAPWRGGDDSRRDDRGDFRGESRGGDRRDFREGKPSFGKPRGDGPPRSGFGAPRGGFGDGPPRGRFSDGPPRGGFGDGPPRGRFGDGPPRGRFGDGPPRGGGFGAKPRPRFGGDDGPPRGAGPGGPSRGRFGDGPPRGHFGDTPPPRSRQRPEPAGKNKGKPSFGKPRGRKGD